MDDATVDAHPLTPTQEGLLYHTLLDDSTGVYVQQIVLRITGLGDPSAMRESWARVLARHPALRTGFYWEGLERPLQAVEPDPAPRWSEHDWSALPEAEREAALDAHLRRDRHAGFALDRPPLVRTALIRFAPATYWMIVSHHHLIMDGWSVSTVLSEVVQTYSAIVRGSSPALPPAPSPWELVRHTAGDEPAARAFWAAELGDLGRPTPIPGLRHASSDSSPDVAETGLAVAELSEADSARLTEAARRHRVSAATLALAGWGLTLAGRSAETEVVFDTTMTMRPSNVASAERTVGVFVTTVPIRMSADGGRGLGDWLRDLQLRAASASRHGHLPLVDIHALSGVPRGEPLARTLLLVQNFAEEWDGHAASAGLTISQRPAVPRTNYPLTVLVTPGTRWSLRVAYDAGRCPPTLAHSLAGGLGAVLRSLARSTPEAAVSGPAGAAPTTPEIVLAGTFTVLPVAEVLQHWCHRLGLAVRTATVPYGRVVPDMLDPAGRLGPDGAGRAGVLLVRIEDFAGPERDPADPEARSRMAENATMFLEALRGAHAQGLAPLLVVVTAPSPGWSHGAGPEVEAVLRRLREACDRLSGVRLVSDDGVAAAYRVETVHDPHGDVVGHVPYSDEYCAALGVFVLRRVLARWARPIAGYVVDADDTLWQGQCGEGPVAADPGSPWHSLQELLRAAARSGRRVGVVGRADERDVLAQLADGGPLGPDDLSGRRMGWGSVSDNLVGLVSGWGVAVKDCVFVTADPVAYTEVRVRCPDATVLLMPAEPEAAAGFVRGLWLLDLP
ncbi:hypothetical protein FE391_45680 [Nonomuraea sp. KC401]|uniref:condensation domain-containing protein n=1 Tax=unclassified Nonomuraea TaxID=2593643 RepID=UPI0010FE4416|nr:MULTISPECIES: condensation domain-containing protein [unclassified Nonomuraea]NBE98022.1 hypothetical protein [Nonomuraea sp. K271]TLF48228.1 hypothetical protein FE391_45680 [Nonomuraea sp. KC401]